MVNQTGHLEKIKEIRREMAAGMLDVRKALEESGGDLDGARRILQERGQAAAWEKRERETAEGRVEAYVHFNGRAGAMVEVGCETDFVARTREFEAFCRDLAMHVASMKPLCVAPEDVPPEALSEQREKVAEEAAAMGKSADIERKIVEGRVEKWVAARALLTQKHVKEPEKTVGGLLGELIQKVGENVVVRRFVHYAL